MRRNREMRPPVRNNLLVSRVRIVVSPDLLTLGEMRLGPTVHPNLESGTAPEFSSLVELLRGNLDAYQIGKIVMRNLDVIFDAEYTCCSRSTFQSGEAKNLVQTGVALDLLRAAPREGGKASTPNNIVSSNSTSLCA